MRFCDSFSFPLLILLDPSPVHDSSPMGNDSSSPLPHSEDLRGAAQLMFAVVEASVPKLALLLSPAATASLINAQVSCTRLVYDGSDNSSCKQIPSENMAQEARMPTHRCAESVQPHQGTRRALVRCKAALAVHMWVCVETRASLSSTQLCLRTCLRCCSLMGLVDVMFPRS